MQASASVALATCARIPHLTPDDHLLRQALAGRGIETAAEVWNPPGIRRTRPGG